MKVLFFINDLARGGKERQCVEIIKYLHLNHKIKCQIILINDKKFYNDLDKYNIPINVLNKGSDSLYEKINNLQKIIDYFNPDIVHTFIGICTSYSVFVKFFNRSYKIVDNSVRGVQKKGQYPYKKIILDKLNFLFSDRVVGNSKAGLKSYGVPKKKGLVIYNGYDFSRNNNLVDKEIIRKKFNIKTKYIVGMVASFIPVKDYQLYFDTAMKICKKNKDISFIAVGDGPQLKYFKAKVKNANTNNILFAGMQNDTESIINTFNVGILLTNSSLTEEGISNTIIEYMALKIPVIASYGKGTAEIIKNNYNGYLLYDRNIDELIKKIKNLLYWSNDNDRVLIEGIKTIETKFNIVNVGTSFYNLYKEIK